MFSAKGGGNNEDLRALLNAGYKRSATVARCVGDAARMRVERFPVFAPVALAGIAGGMPSTITTRAITIHMRRRAPHEHAEPFRERRVESEAAPLRESLAVWLDRVGADHLAGAEPAIPDGVTDRAAEVWEPLFALAEVAGGHWPDTARAAAAHFVSTATSAGVSDRYPAAGRPARPCSASTTPTAWPASTSSGSLHAHRGSRLGRPRRPPPRRPPPRP